MGDALKHADVHGQDPPHVFQEGIPEAGLWVLGEGYENALALELRRVGLTVEQQARIEVYYDGVGLGEYFADLLVDSVVIVELKAIQRLGTEEEAQLLNYLRATPYEVGLLLNFGPRPDFRRKVFDNANKPSMTWIP